MTGQSLPMDQLRRLKRVSSVAAMVGFDHGKMRETDFVAMPQVGVEEKLADPPRHCGGGHVSLLTSRVHSCPTTFSPRRLRPRLDLPALVRQFIAAMSARGISLEELRTAFGEEFEILGDWPADARWPTLVATLPVNDASPRTEDRGGSDFRRIAGAAWTRSDKNGATVYSLQPFAVLFRCVPPLPFRKDDDCSGRTRAQSRPR